MKKSICKYAIISFVLAACIFAGCKSKELSLEQQQKIKEFNSRIDNGSYTFVPDIAMPMGYTSINLTPIYSLKVSKDTIKADLPYFGRSYVAPVNPTELGIKFSSTYFDVKSEYKKAMWKITIATNDTQNHTVFYLSIGNNGSASVSVQESNRQSITFSGRIKEY